jgi:hypothetical protein
LLSPLLRRRSQSYHSLPAHFRCASCHALARPHLATHRTCTPASTLCQGKFRPRLAANNFPDPTNGLVERASGSYPSAEIPHGTAFWCRGRHPPCWWVRGQRPGSHRSKQLCGGRINDLPTTLALAIRGELAKPQHCGKLFGPWRMSCPKPGRSGTKKAPAGQRSEGRGH